MLTSSPSPCLPTERGGAVQDTSGGSVCGVQLPVSTGQSASLPPCRGQVTSEKRFPSLQPVPLGWRGNAHSCFSPSFCISATHVFLRREISANAPKYEPRYRSTTRSNARAHFPACEPHREHVSCAFSESFRSLPKGQRAERGLEEAWVATAARR